MCIVLFLLAETYHVLPFFFATHLQKLSTRRRTKEWYDDISYQALQDSRLRCTLGGPHHVHLRVPPLLDPSGILYFTARGDESHDLSSLLTPMEIWSTGYWWTMIVIVLNMMVFRYRTSWWVFISPYSLISLYNAVWKTKSISLLLFLFLFHTKHSTMMIASRY